MFKRYYIASKFRFSVFIITMVLMIIMSISAMVHNVYAGGKGDVTNTYYAITVESGDTLWEIAQRYSNDNTDIRRFIYEISSINGLDTAEIVEGQQLLIPA